MHTFVESKGNSYKIRSTCSENEGRVTESLTVPPPQWLNQPFVSSPAHLYIHQTAPPFFHESSHTQKPPAAKQGQVEQLNDAVHKPVVFLSLFNRKVPLVKSGTLYVAPAPPWPFSAGSWSGVPCWSVIFSLQSTTITLLSVRLNTYTWYTK